MSPGLLGPSLTGGLALDFLLLLGVDAALFAFVEWWVHKRLMHAKPLPASWYARSPYLASTFENHAVLHHRRYYAVYDHEPDPVGRHLNLRFALSDILGSNLLLLPVHALWWWLAPIGSLALFTMLLAYFFLWNALHTEMHVPTDRWWFRNPVFRFLNRHHYLHHVHPGRNFNVVFWGVDVLLGTLARPTAAERADMEALGLYGGPRGRARLDREAAGSGP